MAEGWSSVPESCLLYDYEIDFGLFHKSIQREFFKQCKTFKISFWVDNEDDLANKNFIICVQNSTNNNLDEQQYVLDQQFFSNYKFKFHKINKSNIKHRWILDWKVETLHSKIQLPNLCDVIDNYI